MKTPSSQYLIGAGVGIGLTCSILYLQRQYTSTTSPTHTSLNATAATTATTTTTTTRAIRSNSALAQAAEKEGYRTADVVAGHSISQLKKEATKDDPVALVRNGLFLKPVQQDVRGEREINFYKTSISDSHLDIPMYKGLQSINNQPYLMLNNVEEEFRHPCTIDIKLGRQTWAPSATPAKMERAKKKWPFMSRTATGVCGMKVYHPVTSTYLRLGKQHGRSLKLNGMLHALTSFLHNGHVVRVDVIENLIAQLRHRRNWLDSSCKYVCYSMSILLVYEGEVEGSCSRPVEVRKGGGGNSRRSPADEKEKEKENKTVVVFVDFAHTFLKESEGGDADTLSQSSDCLDGIDHVIDSLCRIQQLYKE